MFASQQTRSRGIRLAVHGVGLAILLLLTLAFVFLIRRPLSQLRGDHEQRSQQLATLVANGSSSSEQNDQSKQRLERLQAEIARVRDNTPLNADDGVYLTTLAKVAEEEGVELTDYRRARGVVQPTHSQIELHLKCSASYAQLCRFMARVEELPRTTKLSHLQLRTTGTEERYPIEMRLLLYHGLREPAGAAARASDEEAS